MTTKVTCTITVKFSERLGITSRETFLGFKGGVCCTLFVFRPKN